MVKSIINLSCKSGKGFKFCMENGLEARAPKYSSFQEFDCRIAPILFNDAEIWGSERRNQTEKYTYDSANLCLEWAKMRTQQRY